MVVYFHELLENLFSSSKEECGEQIRFVVDLILCLRTNVASLSVFMNLLTNHLLFRHGHQPTKMLHFLGFFYDHMTDHSDFPKDLAEEIILVLSRILGKYFTANAINYTYFTAQKVLATLSIPDKPSLTRFYLARCKKIEHHLIREGGMGEEEKEFEFVLEEWLHFNYKNKEVAPLRDMRVKPKSAIS